ncbi:MAG: MATE family efflux transporter [bacterium]|nr:MATE family efflux transporter [bacterium]
MNEQKRKTKYEIDMVNGSILKKMLLFTLPLMCSSILQLLFNAADIIVVGKFAGDNALAAVGSNTALINLLVNLFVGLSVGANVLVAHYFGAKQSKELKQTVHTSILLGVYSGLILTIIGMAGARVILEMMMTPGGVLPLAVIYLRIYFLGMPAMMVYNFGSAVLRSVGDTKRPLYYLFYAGIVNVILNLLLVIVFKMSVAGVAIATVISQYISAVLVVRCLMNETGAIKLTLSELHIDMDKFMRILKIGLPAGFQGVIFALSNVVIQSAVNSFGEVVVAGNSAAANIEGFIYVSMNAVYQATLSFTGQNLGARQYKRIDQIVITGELLVIAVGAILGMSAVYFGNHLLYIYTDNPAVVSSGMDRLWVIAFTYALCGMMDVMVGGLRGIGYSILPMIVSLLGACVFRLIWLATVFQMPEFHSISVVYWSYPISWILTFLVHVICFLWARKHIKVQLA